MEITIKEALHRGIEAQGGKFMKLISFIQQFSNLNQIILMQTIIWEY